MGKARDTKKEAKKVAKKTAKEKRKENHQRMGFSPCFDYCNESQKWTISSQKLTIS